MKEMNGEKRLFIKLIAWALGVIVLLMGIIWGVTYASLKTIVTDNQNCNNTQNERIAKLEKGLESIDKYLAMIYDEIKDKNKKRDDKK